MRLLSQKGGGFDSSPRFWSILGVPRGKFVGSNHIIGPVDGVFKGYSKDILEKLRSINFWSIIGVTATKHPVFGNCIHYSDERGMCSGPQTCLANYMYKKQNLRDILSIGASRT